jgi:aldose 1-epimerase
MSRRRAAAPAIRIGAIWRAAVLAAAIASGCGRGATVQNTNPYLSSQMFGRTPEGQAVELFTFRNSNGVQVRAMTYGAVIVSITAPDRTGALDDIVLGFDTLEPYLTKSPYFGAVVGRYGNRIANGRFTLDGAAYQLATNDGPNHLHGGPKGFARVVWTADPFQSTDGVGVTFSYTSADGDEGYPGTLTASVTYTLDDQNRLSVDYKATTDKATVVNLTQHSYFNLGGANARDILSHVVQIDADRFTPVDATLIPTGQLAPVQGTPFDFRSPTPIGARIDQPDEQLVRGKGYDHNFVLNRSGAGRVHAVHVLEPASGRTLDVETTEPGVQFYTGNFLDGTLTGKGGRVYGHRSGFCLETQHFPDSPNHPAFPSTVLRPGQTFQSKTVFAFGVQR